jgi:RimJ/RimL family protein N-acetyltransferase
MSWGPNDETASQAFVQAVMAGQNADPRQNYDLAITLKDNGKLIGGCGIYRRKFREGEMGYCLHRSYWSQGYMTEAAGALLEFAFTVEDYHRVYATCDPENIGSARVMEKIGEIPCFTPSWIGSGRSYGAKHRLRCRKYNIVRDISKPSAPGNTRDSGEERGKW